MPLMKKNNTHKPSQPNQNWRHRLAHWVTDKLYGQSMHITSYKPSLVVASVVFWYDDHGVRKFLMVRDVSTENPTARFAGCLESKTDAPISKTLHDNIKYMMGEQFARTIDETLLEPACVKAAPTLSMSDKATGEKLPVQGVVWMIQITKSQIELCNSQDGRLEVVALPQFAMTGNDINPAHKVIYQAIRQHFPAGQSAGSKATLDRTGEFLDSIRQASKNLH